MTKSRNFLFLLVSGLVVTLSGLLVTISPAYAAPSQIQCRDPYTTGSWNVYPCIYNGGYIYPPSGPRYERVVAYAQVFSRPSNCTYYRVYIVDENRVERFSTSLRPCTTGRSTDVEVWDGEFGGLRVFARFKAFSGTSQNLTQILSIDSPSIPSLDDD